MDRDDYVIRSTRRKGTGRVTYDIVDLAGRLLHVTVPYHLSGDDGPTDILRAAVRALPAPGRR